MTLYLEDEKDFFGSHEGLYEDVLKVIDTTLELEKVPFEVEISLSVVDALEIQEINRMHRQIDRATDVLSFPQIDAVNGEIDWQQLDYSGLTNLDTEELILGDIVLCEEVAQAQSESYGHTLRREICFLVAHSMFHLLGYDHMTETEEKIMIEKQETTLRQLGILR